MLKEIAFLINDVREQTDNTDINGVKDREFIRYFNDGVKSIQAMIFKNNPLCSYHQASAVLTAQVANARVFDLPADVFGDNAVSMVEISSDGGTCWSPLDRAWAEEGDTILGWFTRNKQVYITGRKDVAVSFQVRAWYFQRLPRFDKAWATVTGVAGQVITMTVLDADFYKVDRYISIYTALGVLRKANLSYVKTSDTTITVVGDLTGVVNTDVILMGAKSTLVVDLPEEVEPYLMDYVAQRVVGRNNYTEDWNKMNFWTSEERANIIAIFADASQAETRLPITDMEYMRI